jgi:hypothetical protein
VQSEISHGNAEFTPVRHLALMGIAGRDEVRAVGIASGQLRIANAGDHLLDGRVYVFHGHCPSLHLTISGASALVLRIAAAIASLLDLKSKVVGGCLPPSCV